MPVRCNELWLGLHCPQLPLLAAWQCDPEVPELHAVHGHQRGRHIILQASSAARRAGVTPGQPLATALAIAPALQSRPRHSRAEAALLEQLALGAWQGSSHVVQAPSDGVLLEIAGSRRLYGGLRPLVEALCADLERRGLPVRAGSAPVPATARLFARHGLHAADREIMRRKLHGLPLTALALDDRQARALAGCGLDSVAGLLRLPAPERARRFGPALNRHLLCLEGRAPTPLAAWQPPEVFCLRLELPAASSDSAALLFVFRRAIERMAHWLDVRDQALTRLHVTLHREDGGGRIPLEVGLSRPGMDAERLLELLALKLENLELPAPVEAVELRAESTGEHRPPQADLWSGHNRGDAWPALLDRLKARLGEAGLSGLAPQPDHRPEKAWRWVEPGTSSNCEDERPRPTWLLPAPCPCRRENLRLEDGPERIEAGWWDEEDCRRDYFVARDRHGRRLWVFHEHRPREGWFIHGLFD
ncbi:Y-family DNA polymerase [Wenzhouxiangella sediminis]|uniref:DNA polymerase Y family protein n=1 Tax=Wenzhouxiangella sediminis TaxID=1792836 RepID=A0A3E1KC93_9GAMM|nr:DNA polymerase Y family protein [Wenzhouxiangella sediminis]RFF32227.1 DNA polymerase Y family protein [Wenzhouxiangella sediminis]